MANILIVYVTDICFSDKDWQEYENLRPKVEAEDPLKMMAGTCYTRLFKPDWFDFVMSPLCQAKLD